MGTGRLIRPATGVLRQIQLNDGPAWDSLHPGQFIVFLSDVRKDVLLDSGGSAADDRTCIPVFDSLAQAEEYAREAVSDRPSACASVYDYRGRAGDPLHQFYHESVRHRYDPERRARRFTWAGSIFLSAFVVWAFFGARSQEHFLWFYLLGLKLFVVGTTLLIQGVGFFLGRRGQKASSPRRS